jgi:membrane protease YdiL (CAAX protease family)
VWARRLWVAEDGAVRTPWRLALFIGIAILATVLAQGFVYPVLSTLGRLAGLRLILFGWLTVAGLLIAHYVMLRRIDRLPWSASGLDRSAARPGRLAAGAIIGALGIGLPTVVLWGIGWMRIEPQPDGSSLAEAARVALALVPLAFVEELMVRGYPLTVLRRVLDWRLAVLATSIVFGLLHVWNPGATVWSLTVVTVAGLMLGTIVVLTGSLYAATAAHVAWNWTMAGVLHVPVSGLDNFPTPDFRLVDAGPDWATGGSWGPEGGIGAVFGMTVATAYIYGRWRRRLDRAHD